jgi:ATP-dependent Clp protease, protease subunit
MPRKSVKQPVKTLSHDIDIDQLMLHSRQLHLTGMIGSKVVQPLIKQIMALQLISDDPIILWINSGGGYIADGFALIDCVRMSKVPVYTVIRGQACSMAGIIAISGHSRLMTEHSFFMAHDIHCGVIDYGEKMKARVEFYALEQTQAFNFLKENTKLTNEELDKAKNQELWLNPDQCLEKGVVDQIIRFQERKEK